MRGGASLLLLGLREKTATTMMTAHATDIAIPATTDVVFAFVTTMTTATATTAMTRTKRKLLLDHKGFDLCAALFGPRFLNRGGGLLAISLSNLNPQNHLGIVLANMRRMDPPPLHNNSDPLLQSTMTPKRCPCCCHHC